MWDSFAFANNKKENKHELSSHKLRSNNHDTSSSNHHLSHETPVKGVSLKRHLVCGATLIGRHVRDAYSAI